MRGWDGERPGEGRESACRMCEPMELRSVLGPDEGKWMCATGDTLPRSSLGTQCTQPPPPQPLLSPLGQCTQSLPPATPNSSSSQKHGLRFSSR